MMYRQCLQPKVRFELFPQQHARVALGRTLRALVLV